MLNDIYLVSFFLFGYNARTKLVSKHPFQLIWKWVWWYSRAVLLHAFQMDFSFQGYLRTEKTSCACLGVQNRPYTLSLVCERDRESTAFCSGISVLEIPDYPPNMKTLEALIKKKNWFNQICWAAKGFGTWILAMLQGKSIHSGYVVRKLGHKAFWGWERDIVKVIKNSSAT